MNVALIGYGYWGPNLARNICDTQGVKLYGICDFRPNMLEKAKKNYKDEVKYSCDYKEFIDSPEVGAVAIATQTDPSFQIAMDALSAGKHVFMEKPIASTYEKALKIKELGDRKGLVIHCDHIMLYNPVIRYIKNMIDAGELGDIMYIDISRINLGPIRKDVNAMLDLAVHDIAVIDFLGGGQQYQSMSVMGQALFGVQEAITYLTIKYASFIAHIKSSWVSPMKERRMMIAGTKKMAIFDDVKVTEKLAVYDHGFKVNQSEEYGAYEVETRTGDIFIPNIPYSDSLKNSFTHFIDCISKGSTSLSGPDHSLRVMKVLEAALNDLRRKD